MQALVVAGGVIDPRNPFYEQHGPQPRGLLPLAGKPMVQWVLDALAETPTVMAVTIIGQAAVPSLTCGGKALTCLPDAGGMLPNTLVGLQKITTQHGPKQVLVLAGDVPLVTSEMLQWIIAQGDPAQTDILYPVVTRQVMEAQFPGAKRTYVRLRDGEWCGGDGGWVHTRVLSNLPPWLAEVAQARKHFWRIAGVFGWGLMLRFLTGQLTRSAGLDAVSQRMGLRLTAVDSPFAALGMDVDKPVQAALAEQVLQQRRLGSVQ